jgi:GrpB-like predicted nucleotidyltransferase (UPF0157 family)
VNQANPRPPTLDGRQWSEPPIRIAEADPAWPQRYLEEARSIQGTLLEHGIQGVRLEHFGSTAVAGLAAKPIIDILLLPPPDCDWQRLLSPLESLGYRLERQHAEPPRLFFVKAPSGNGGEHSHHLHVLTLGEADLHLRFRDHLRRHPEDVAAYAALKRNLASHYASDREAYTRGKDAFVAALIAQESAVPQGNQ